MEGSFIIFPGPRSTILMTVWLFLNVLVNQIYIFYSTSLQTQFTCRSRKWRLYSETKTDYKVLAYFLYAGTKLLVPDSPKVLSCGLEANLGKVPSKVPISTICPTRSLSVVSFVISSLTSSNVGSWNKLGSKDSFTWRAFDASRCGRSMWCKKIWKFLSLWQHNHLLHPHASNARCVNAS